MPPQPSGRSTFGRFPDRRPMRRARRALHGPRPGVVGHGRGPTPGRGCPDHRCRGGGGRHRGRAGRRPAVPDDAARFGDVPRRRPALSRRCASRGSDPDRGGQADRWPPPPSRPRPRLRRRRPGAGAGRARLRRWPRPSPCGPTPTTSGRRWGRTRASRGTRPSSPPPRRVGSRSWWRPPPGPKPGPGRSLRAGRRPGPPAVDPEPELRQVTPDRPLTSDPVSGEWAVASGLGGGIGSARAGRSLRQGAGAAGAPI